MCEIKPLSASEIEYGGQVYSEATDEAMRLLRVAIGSMIDDLETLRCQLGNLQLAAHDAKPLAARRAALRGRKLFREACDKLWAELPFDCVDLVADADKEERIKNHDYVVGGLVSFIKAAKPVFAEDFERCGKQ